MRLIRRVHPLCRSPGLARGTAQRVLWFREEDRSQSIWYSDRAIGKIIAFGWYAGKFSHLDWLLPLLPKTKHYCEPFGGMALARHAPLSAAVLINREPSLVETYNDIDGEVVNFFRVLREWR